ncbi:hypothetical protein [Ornithinibacillus halotolerans]|uniref:Flagellar hook-length control protein FliK n=1 Tax=Ornithinibacillus halotolerans TaxID=1274357 RepID=A0A916SBC6_9BACI|nr:hypothetical protein [Ornithinibacillus halotolerans]GGA92198.1 hypothetical protein GCM10008025_38310 [Ornithinibacillus halotolerans]
MNIQRTLFANSQSVKEPIQTLKVGQIIPGRVLKFYPNNTAQIQLGNTSLNAQLEAPLSVGSNYYFQVMTKGSIIQLKVIGESLERKRAYSLHKLLNYIGVKYSKVNEDFIQQLFQKEIVIDPKQIKQAIDILSASDSKSLTKVILLEMIRNNLPISLEVYTAIESTWTSSFSKKFHALITELSANKNGLELMNQNRVRRIDDLLGKTNKVPKNFVQLIAANRDYYQLVKELGLIQLDSVFEDWISPANQAHNNGFQFDRQTLVHILSNYEDIREKANSFLTKWNDTIQTLNHRNEAILDGTFHKIKNDLEQFYHLILKEQIEIADDPIKIRDYIVSMERLAKIENTPQLAKLYHEYMKALFMEQIKMITNDVGLQYEKTIYKDNQNPTFTLKGLLLQLMSVNDNSVKGMADKFLQYINGLQIQSVHDTEKFLQANLLIPGQGLGLKNDLSISFQGKKNSKGEIDPDYCKVVFMLDLEHINETIIEMHVQKRTISLQIMNDHPLTHIANSVKPLLKEGLDKIGYHLSSITYHQFTSNQQNGNKTNLVNKANKEIPIGVDFRI